METNRPSTIDILKQTDLLNDVLNLRKNGYSYEQIVEKTNRALPEGLTISKTSLARMIEKHYPDLAGIVAKKRQNNLILKFASQIDIVQETMELFYKAKDLMQKLEDDAENRGAILNPTQFKQVAEIMIALTRQTTDIQKEMSEYSNIKKFIEVVIQILHEEAPELLPIVMDRLNVIRDTKWFANIVRRHIDD